ncbi:nitroreductase family protein [Staphylococcus felis]|uniref:Nitroreductase family protein n=1 Tax=Staphylococcus felis TaxID=46127 RepID=A0A3E0IGL6_9STAP|nr:nitroreductase family protein [Staphylococcus felis]MBH9580752.1 nitroreductase family protein [Staphylococcus felis]MDM8327967.1 nitroreductase family protein [Staphylococcus felis]MDQ7193748.1 nitroreductase family protein [Staphylococcus felis]REH78784.1 nitroreductase family protein [Staphylococcus felis]REH82597.1 nitroreductase family protein [Staphylococcus felis]
MPLNNHFDDILKGRRSVKVFDENVKIPRSEMDEILTKATLAPSSINMQPWRLVVVDTEEGKEKLRPLVRFNSRQNDTSAAMIVIFGDMLNYEYAEDIYGAAVEKGYMPKEIKEELVERFVTMYKALDRQAMNDIVKVDSSLMAMQLMLVARQYGYDTNPIGGFDRENIAQAFDLDPERYVPVMIVAIGKEAVEGRPSYRLPINKIVQYH